MISRVHKNLNLYAQINKEKEELKYLYEHRDIIYRHDEIISDINEMRKQLEEGGKDETEGI